MRWLLIQIVLLYRVTLGQILGGQCRYQPTCSQYAIDAINKYGAWRGGWRAARRVARCHPWGRGGYDPPRPRRRLPFVCVASSSSLNCRPVTRMKTSSSVGLPTETDV